jgi:hypothetical protein
MAALSDTLPCPRCRRRVDADRCFSCGLPLTGEKVSRLRAVVDRLDTIERAQYALTDLLTGASEPASLRSAVAAATGTSFLLVTAGDVPDEGNAAVHIAGGAPDRVEIWTVAGAGHTDGLEAAPEEWERRVIAFLDAHLG